MLIRDNPTGRRSFRSYSYNRGKLSKSLEKLSSGYQINRSADDAAGLAISEKMRAQITGTNRAYKNSAEGTDLLQIGEGALDEIHQILNRAEYLADSSANGTYQDKIDREALQRELDQLCDEIDRITKTTRFNSIQLFQDKGYDYETTAGAAFPQEAPKDAIPAEMETAAETKAVAERQNGISIVYTEHESVTATTSPSGTDGKGSLEKVIHYADGSTKNLSEVLEKEIVPNIVKNVMRNYPAFSYLQGSTIGIGLEYFSEGALGGTTTLAAVRVGFQSDGQGDYLNYTLRVNTAALKTSNPNGDIQRDDLQDLETTIAHEMVHAFMDEATTAGMIGFGRDPTSPTDPAKQVTEFPSWFIEGMAQTASGPDNWLSHVGIIANATDRDISNAVSRAKLGSSTGESDYGTGYLACMYLGAVIGNGGKQPTGAVIGETILVGLNRLMNSVIGGKSLDGAIDELTSFTGLTDFETRFNGGTLSTSIGAFTRGLLLETGAGRGGMVSGNLSATDLAPDDPDTSVTLFKLDTGSNSVQNTYPSNHEIYSGGAATADGIPPTGFTEGNLQKEFGEFLVTGAADADIEYDASTHTLKVKAGGDIIISMKTPEVTASLDKILVENSTTGKITLSGIQTSLTLTVEDGAKVEFEIEGENQIDRIELGTSNAAEAVFSGSGTLNVNTFVSDSSDQAALRSGAIIVGGGTGSIDASAVVDKAFIGASFTGTVTDSAGKTVNPISIPWNNTALKFSLDSITSMTVDGVEYQVSLPNGQQGNFWFDPDTLHRVTFGGTSGGKKVQKTLVAEADSNKNLTWKEPDIPFTVTGNGVRDTDWSYDAATNTLKILTVDKELTISGGTMMNDDGTTTIGRIEIADDICGADPTDPTAPRKILKLNLSGLDCVMKTNQSAMSLGKNNDVLLTLTDGSINNLTSGASHEGIAIGTGTNLIINGNTGILNATGGSNGAGIGRSQGLSDMKSKLTINGGNITAVGGSRGAGIGSTASANFGDIEINGGTIHAEGGASGGAGIGAADSAKVGNITIHNGSVTAKSNGHGAGIGGGWESTSTNGEILIDGGSITALSLYHGTGIGSGCQGTSGKITITGNAVIESAIGGDDGAGIGASWIGTCKGIEISGNAEVKLAQGGDKGAGIGAGSSRSKVLDTTLPDGTKGPAILIDTTSQVNAKGGQNGVGIGSGCQGSAVGNIWIKQGTVSATGSTDATGIGCGRDSTSADITIGDPDNEHSKVIVSATGGLTNAGGNILSYTNPNRTDGSEGKLIVTGINTSVRPGAVGEGKFSTSGAVGTDDKPLYAYPLYLFKVPDGTKVLDAGENVADYHLPLPDDATNIQISVDGVNLEQTLTHKPLDENYTFIWMTGEDHRVEVSYQSSDNSKPNPITLDLKFYDNAGVFRTEKQKDPPDATKPEYNVKDPPKPSVDPTPDPPDTPGPTPSKPDPEPEPEPEPPREPRKGLILQIGANTGDTLEIPLFYLSRDALRLGELNISTQENAWKSMPVIREAINRVSTIRGSYGAYMNRLEHNRADLSQSAENLSDAESTIRDTDFAKEYMNYVKQNIQVQAAQTMLAHSNQDASRVLQLIV